MKSEEAIKHYHETHKTVSTEPVKYIIKKVIDFALSNNTDNIERSYLTGQLATLHMLGLISTGRYKIALSLLEHEDE